MNWLISKVWKAPWRSVWLLSTAFLRQLIISARVSRRERYGVWWCHFIPRSKERNHQYNTKNHTDFSSEVKRSQKSDVRWLLFRSQNQSVIANTLRRSRCSRSVASSIQANKQLVHTYCCTYVRICLILLHKLHDVLCSGAFPRFNETNWPSSTVADSVAVFSELKWRFFRRYCKSVAV
jgi:hypothetical protein